MSRPTSGEPQFDVARAQVKAARCAAQLRAAQAVLLHLEPGLTLEQTAVAIGRSVGATCRMRTTFCAVASGRQKPAQAKTSLRNRTNSTSDAAPAPLAKDRPRYPAPQRRSAST